MQPIEIIIEDIEKNKSIFETYKLEILGRINEIIDQYKDEIENSIEIYKNQYFCIQDMNLQVCPTFDNIYVKFLDNNKLLSQVPIINYNQMNAKNLNKMLQDKINSLLYGIAKEYLGNKLKKLINKSYSIHFVDRSDVDKITKTSSFWSGPILEISNKVLTDKNLYDLIKQNIVIFFENESLMAYVNDFQDKYQFKIKQMNENVDLENGYLNKSYNWQKDIKNFYKIIKAKQDEFNYLRFKAQENEMHEMKLMDQAFIKKVEEKVINEDKYTIYKCIDKKRKNHIFFKNGKRVGRYKYHEVVNLTGYNSNVDIKNIDNPDWYKISKLPLTNEQIELYKDKLNWHNISRHRRLTDDMLIKYAKYIDWKYVLLNRNVKWKVITTVAPVIGWSIISRYWKDINDEFIDKHLNDLDIEQLYHNPAYKSFKDTIETLLS